GEAVPHTTDPAASSAVASSRGRDRDTRSPCHTSVQPGRRAAQERRRDTGRSPSELASCQPVFWSPHA
ncbi:MAG: hypothetical protein LC799_15825, partial [Actinobacteria bacterium]|nr:hypothetical protein [Actinomycetota bacterium]